MLPCQLNIAVDGPAGAGKSTVSQAVAAALGLSYLDTGAMYRAITWKALQRQIPPTAADRLADLAKGTSWALTRSGALASLLMDGQPLPEQIRSDQVTSLVSSVSAHPKVREVVVRQQRVLCQSGGFISDGRDIGTVVMPQADLKVFLTASVATRAERRRQEQGKPEASLPLLIADLSQRDAQDSNRAHSPLHPAEDAWILDTTGMSFQEVVSLIVHKARSICAGEV